MRERKERKEGGKRSSTFSLDLMVIGLSASIEVRGEVLPRDESFA